MRRVAPVIVAGMLLAMGCPTWAVGDEAASVPPVTCGNGVPGGVSCITSKKDVKQARNAYTRGLKLQEHQHWDEAYAAFDQASRLVPQDAQFLGARELAKAQLVFQHLERGNDLLSQNESSKAATEFRAALDLAPENQFDQQRPNDAPRHPDP